MAAKKKHYVIYGSGDLGSEELYLKFIELAVPVKFIDLRDQPRKGKSCGLTFLNQKRLMTVPQVFAPNGELIGNYQRTMEHLEKISMKEPA